MATNRRPNHGPTQGYQRWLLGVGITLAQRQDDQRWLYIVGPTMAQREVTQRWLFCVGLTLVQRRPRSQSKIKFNPTEPKFN